MPRSRIKDDSKASASLDKGITMRTLGPRDAESVDSPVAGSSSNRSDKRTERKNRTKHEPSQERRKKWWTCIYNPETKEFLGRRGSSWFYIICYSIMYLLFLSTYTMLFLYLSLHIIKSTGKFNTQRIFLSTYAENGIGLSATPTAVNSIGNVIWYHKEDQAQIEPYIKELDALLHGSRVLRRPSNVDDLGPCGVSPYGYGDHPCVIFRINRLAGWVGKPLTPASPITKNAPAEVQKWIASKQMLWLHCSGHYPWDKEHLGEIKYYPDPPGIDPSFYPQNVSSPSPLVAAQFKGYTLGMSLVVECRLWHANGNSTVTFVLYVAPSQRFYLRGNRTLPSESRL